MEETGKINIKTQEEAECECCLHQRRLGGWKEAWCQPTCIRNKFPSWAWGLWELAGYVMVPIIGFGAVAYRIDGDEFDKWLKTIGIDREKDLEDFLEVRNLLQYLISTYDEKKPEDVRWDRKDYEFLNSTIEEEPDEDGEESTEY